MSLTNLIHVQLQYPTPGYRITMIPIPIHDSLSGARMDSSFYLLPKNGVPPSITMFSFKNVTLKNFQFISDFSYLILPSTTCRQCATSPMARTRLEILTHFTLHFLSSLDIPNHALVSSSFSCSRLPALCTGKPRIQALPPRVYATYPTNTTSKRKLFKPGKGSINPYQVVKSTNLASLMHHPRMELPLLVEP